MCRNFALPENSAVLDIGCGRGHVLNLILSQHPVKGTGVDPSTPVPHRML